MKQELTADEIHRRKFWKFVCREGLYFPSVRLDKQLVFDSDKYDLVNRRRDEDWPTFEETTKTINGWPALLVTGYFRMPDGRNPRLFTESKYGIAQYHWASKSFKFFNAKSDKGLQSGALARLEKERATRHKERMKFERQVNSNLDFIYIMYDEVRDAGVKGGLIHPRQGYLACIEFNQFAARNPSKIKQAHQGLMNFLHYIQINNIMRLINRRL